MGTSNDLIFFVNGKKIVVENPDPEMTLMYFLRYKLHLTGTKSGCAEGGCGACTVMFSRYDVRSRDIKHYAVNACLSPLCALHGIAVTTVEGLGSVRTKMHPVQREIAENHGSQCGFCTPGIVMSMYALLRNNATPTKRQICEAFDGNLCRCTGYRPILDGLYQFAQDQEKAQCPMGGNCCKNMKTRELTKTVDAQLVQRTISQDAKPLYDATQEPIFPPELKLICPQLNTQSMRFESNRCVWLRPTNLTELLEVKHQHPDCRLVTGNTEIGIEMKFRKLHYSTLVSTALVEELHDIETTTTGLRIGAAVTLAEVEQNLTNLIDICPEEKTRVFAAFLEMLQWFAGRQIRNVASIGGNVINASPISDLNPLLMACNAELELVSKGNTKRIVKMDANFFRGYRKTCLEKDEILVSITLPFTKHNEYCFGYKQANRRDDDIAIVNSGMRVNLGESGTHIEDITLAYGGMAANTVLATGTMKALIGKKWDESIMEIVCSKDMLPHDIPLAPGSPGGMVAYRRTLTLSFFFRFFMAVSQRVKHHLELNPTHFGSPDDVSASDSLLREPSQGGCQLFQIEHSEHFSKDTIGKPIVHRAAHLQCTGEAMYMDDLPVSQGELFLGLVTSKKAHARLVKVDLSPALTMPGVVDVLDHNDVPACNNWDQWEQVFATDKVVHEGQVIAAVVARTQAEAQRAAQNVIVEYDEIRPIISIEDAIKHRNFFPSDELKLDSGDVDAAMSTCAHTVTGAMHVSAQEHFYLEPHGCVVYPRDVGEIEVFATTQSPTQMQKTLLKVLGIKENHITVKVKRLGGGFGGKETRNAGVLMPTAVAAVKTNRVVRCVLDRDEDMCLTGTRHPAYCTYKIGFESSGKIVALDADLYLNMGHSLDLSYAVLETALLDMDSAYNIKNFRVQGHLCQTNLTSCTAFRGFGGPQAIIIAENYVGHVADFLQMPPEKVREMNFYDEGEITPCGQEIKLCNIRRCWDECINNSDYYDRKLKVEEYNKGSRWKKRGIALTPLKYGLAFLLQSMNQGGAFINVYTDGTILLSHGGVEMGQGLHTKMIQVVSRELEVPVTDVHVCETSTSKVPNAGPTAASMSSDLYGAAAIDACRKLNERLAPYKKAIPKGTMADWAHAAHQDRVSLSSIGFYKLDNVNLDWSRKINTPFSYFSFGAACTEVEIDCLTGDHQVLRTDIVMDVGKSLNPSIDIGQIEGAFMQGYGLVALEDYKMSASGTHLSRGPGTYKIPAFGNIPNVMNVALLSSSRNPRAVYSSKGVGEPPLCLATSVLMAFKDAIAAARIHSGHTGYFRLDTPATPDKIRMACLDQFVEKFIEDDKKDKENPWNVQL